MRRLKGGHAVGRDYNLLEGDKYLVEANVAEGNRKAEDNRKNLDLAF